MNYESLFQTIDSLQKNYEQFLLDVCNIESPTDYKEGVDRVGAYFIERAREHGWEADVHEEAVAGNAVCITMNKDAKGAPIALSGHMDTVHPLGSFGTPAAHIEEDKLYGPGAVDCKGGIVAAFLAMDALERCGFAERPVMLLLQSDEENGSRFSEKRTIQYICEKAKDAEAFLNCEGHSSGNVCLQRKGILKYEFRVYGRAVHASKCGDGISAIAEAAYKILELEKLKDGGWGITCNCGLISGGTAENSVPAECVFTADIRVTSDEDIAWVKNYVKKIAETSFVNGSRCEVVLKSHRVAMQYHERNVALLDRMNAVYEKVGLPTMKPIKGHGGSDAADVSAYGIPCVDNIGAGGKYIHNVNEYARLASIGASAKRMAAVVAYL